MTTKPKVGLLPFYITLYDEVRPQARSVLEDFAARACDMLKQQGLTVISAPTCRLKEEFESAIQGFEKEDADAIVTLHMAYSPSLESIDALAGTALPIIVLDTTMDHGFGPDVAAERIMFNHGIHGVQDMTCMLRRHGKPYHIAAGHITESDVVARTANLVRAAHAARELGRTKALGIGEAFKGMGDFSVSEDVMQRVLGVTVDRIDVTKLAPEVEKVSAEDVDTEMAADRKRFQYDVDEDVHRRSVRVGLALRRVLQHGGYGAFSMNFLAFRADTVEPMPFLEASKAMARGIGYAGEGDVLTASLVGALARGFGGTTFTEIFCPDWKGGSLFLSHMGEINPDLAAGKPLLFEKPYPFTDAGNPAVASCSLTPGAAVLVNLAPGPDDTFRLILAPVEVLEDTSGEDMQKVLRGWIKPAGSTAEFLEAYSRLGGTHHSALVMGDRCQALQAFAEMAGLECCVIRND